MNCLRCGRRIDEGKTFCPDCEKLVSRPLPDSPFLDRRIVLPERKATPRQTEKRQREKNERRAERAEQRRRRGRRVLLAGLLLLLAVSVAGGLLRTAQLKAALRSREAALQDNAAVLSRVRDQLTAARGALRELSDELETLQGEYDVMSKEHAAARDELTRSKEALEFVRDHVALIERGKARYYHTAGCPDFDATGYQVTSVSQALRWGYLPCPTCHGEEDAE